MRIAVATGCVLLAVSVSGWTAQVVERVDWAKIADEGRLPAGARLGPDEVGAGGSLEVAHEGPGPLQLGLLTLEGPAITTPRWALEGRVRCRDVDGAGYLEMWSVFADGGAYFSRSLAQSGPLRALTGSQEWRRFVLPFTSRPDMPAPVRLQLNLVLPGAGTVMLGPLRLVEYGEGEVPLASGAWWNDRLAGWIGAAGGSLLGVLGMVAGVLIARGRSRRVVVSLLAGFAAVGAAGLAGGVAALVGGQPYAVWYPLLLVGVIGTVLGTVFLLTVGRRYRLVEERRMRAMDV